MKRGVISFLVLLAITGVASYATEYHVSKKGDDLNNGSASAPFKTISEAVKHAWPGDSITVHEGTYREWINPIRGGQSNKKRIVYRAAPGEHVEIKGSELVQGWEKVGNGVWFVKLKNSFFGTYNPFQDSIHGDWFNDHGRIHHTGEVFLNNKSLWEKESLDHVLNPVPDTTAIDPSGSTYTWYCESSEDVTSIWVNFHEANPNEELVEVSVRSTCIYPDQPGIDFITIKGFHVSQAATQWAAPTAEQIGMISTHWNKGWIIEDNVISNSKCSGITLGKERSTGHNVWSADPSIRGSIHYIEVTFRALRHGWKKENIGSHVVRNNTIFDCGQTGMCGSMGAAFSTIENNHIYKIWTKRQYSGAEMAGIKFHAAIDAVIRNNRIHDCGKGIWLDWMTQGTRVSQNILYNNDIHDLWLEVNHGPFVVDNNLLLSPLSIETMSQGGAFIHNIIAGRIWVRKESSRFTPYHLPHSTEVAGLSTIYSGDDRYYNNIFIGAGNSNLTNMRGAYGLEDYNKTELSNFMGGNIYYHGSKPSKYEESSILSSDYDPGICLSDEAGGLFLTFEFDQVFQSHRTSMVTTDLLGLAKIPKQAYENPDGSPLKIDVDYRGNRRSGETTAGPFSGLNRGKNRIKVW